MTRQYRGRGSYKPRPSSKTRFWYIGKRNKNNEIIGLLILVLLIGGGAWNSLSQQGKTLLIVLLASVIGIVFVGAFAFVAFTRYRKNQRLLAMSAAQVDQMDGFEFEHYVAALLSYQGYSHVQVTQARGDYGIDIISSKDGQRWAIQAKRYNRPVSQEAVREAVAGCAHYQCQRSMVVTTSHFTPHAQALAHSNRTLLVDREELAKWIIDSQNAKKHA